MKCWFLWYEFSVNVYLICKIYKYWQQITEQQIVTTYLCQHVYRYQYILDILLLINAFFMSSVTTKRRVLVIPKRDVVVSFLQSL